jgi:hypothetical protein
MFPYKIPWAAKLAGTVFLAILVPVYWHTYGPTNFLWFCDAALVLTVAGMLIESSLLISMCAVGILIPQCFWLADVLSHLFGFHLLGLTDYMFDSRLSLFTRGLSLFHGWLPLLLVWLLFRVGFSNEHPQTWINPNLYALLWPAALWFVAFLPTHLALRKLFATPQEKEKCRMLNEEPAIQP